MTAITTLCSFSKKNGPIMPLDQNPHHLLRTTVNCCWWRTLSATTAIFSSVRTVFGFSRFGLSMRIPSFFSQHTELTVLLFFQNTYAIFAHILQHYHDFQSNVAIFPSEMNKRIHSHIRSAEGWNRHELSVTIHETSTNWKKKNVRQRTQYFRNQFLNQKMIMTLHYNWKQ